MSSEAEWLALLETLNEDMFMIPLLWSMNISIRPPVMVRVDSMVATFMPGNISAMSNTKHIDIRYKYVNDHV